jgi:hypothetical protein
MFNVELTPGDGNKAINSDYKQAAPPELGNCT